MITNLPVRDYHTLWSNFPVLFQFVVIASLQSYYPNAAVTTLVWALSLSLAATQEIDLSFFSSSYLDVSVQRVCSPSGVTGLLPAGLPHSDILGSSHVC